MKCLCLSLLRRFELCILFFFYLKIRRILNELLRLNVTISLWVKVWGTCELVETCRTQYSQVVSSSPATANVLLIWANHFTLLASLTKAIFCYKFMGPIRCAQDGHHAKMIHCDDLIIMVNMRVSTEKKNRFKRFILSRIRKPRELENWRIYPTRPILF